MRLLLALCLAGPAHAWEFSPTPLCTLSHETDEASIVITFDASQPLYTLTVTLRDATWPASPTFGMAFAGPRGLSIGTDRHSIDGPTLTVSDTGFGNVLNGLQFNDTATAVTDQRSVTFPLEEAAPAVEAFRKCPEANLA